MHARKRLLLACALGIALVSAVPVAAQAPRLGVLVARGVADPAAGRLAVVVLHVTEPSSIDLAVFAPSAPLPLLTERVSVERRYRFVWDATDVWGNPVPPGTYRLEVDCTCGSRDGVRETVELQVADRGSRKPPGGGGSGSLPDPPTGLGVVASEANALSWTASPSTKIAAYRVYRATQADGPFQLLGESPATTFGDTPAEKAIYWYRVTAVDPKRRESRPTDAVSSDNVHMTEVVGVEGGTLAPTTGTVRLEIPAGAIPSETTITIDQLGAPPAPAANAVAVSRSFEIGPSDTTFAVPATLTLQLDAPGNQPLPASHPADTTWVQYWTSSGWRSLKGGAVDTAASTVEVPIEHLSMFGASGITVPHGGYSSETSLCGFCHMSHKAPGPTLRAYATESETCYQCHNSGQGTKVNEVQRITFTGTWLTGDLFRLSLQDHETADIAFGATPAATSANIKTALLALPNIDDPPNDGVSVTGTGPFDVTFQNGQGNQDVPQMLARSFTSSPVAVTTTTPGVGIWAGAVNDLLGTFGETWPVSGTSTRTSSHPVAAPRNGVQISCSDCHTPHKDPADPQYAKLLRRPNGTGGWLYTLNGATPITPIGNQFCTLACHDSTSAPFGNLTTFTGTAHDTQTGTVPAVNEQQRLTVNATGGTFTLTFRAGTTAAQPYNVTAANLQTALAGLANVGSGNVTVTGGPGGTNPLAITFTSVLAAKDLSPIATNAAGLTGGAGTAVVTTTQNGRAAQPSGDIRCLNCHDPHAGDSRRLTDASQETLCYSCHTAGTPNTSGARLGSWPAAIAALFPGSNVFNAFTATPNDYTAGAVRIYHHPISTSEQAGGTRQVECASCHNSHLADRTDSATTSKTANPANVSQKWIFEWDFTSGYLSRSRDSADDDAIPEATEFCITCHDDATAPPNAGTNVPYSIRLVNDGAAHERFDAATWPNANHAYPDAPTTYNSCDARGVSNANCVVTCTNCHDPHGSTNAFMLRETIVPPDYVTFTVTRATWDSKGGGVATLEYLTPSGLACTSSVKTGCTVGKGVIITVTGVSWPGYNGVFTTTNSAVSPQAGPIEYAVSNPGGSGATGGTVAPPSSFTMTGWDGSSSNIRSWCLSCHIEIGADHRSGACTNCHDHTVSGIGSPTQL